MNLKSGSVLSRPTFALVKDSQQSTVHSIKKSKPSIKKIFFFVKYCFGLLKNSDRISPSRFKNLKPNS